MRLLAMFFIALYALASGRSLVPGLCATQSALDREAASIAAAFCCADSMPHRTENDGSSSRPVPKTLCTFCKLALAICVAEPTATAVAAEAQKTPYTDPEHVEHRFVAIANTNIGRDPPAFLS